MANALRIDIDAVANAYEGEIDREDETTVRWLTEQIDKAVRALIGDCPTLLRRLAEKSVDALLPLLRQKLQVLLHNDAAAAPPSNTSRA